MTGKRLFEAFTDPDSSFRSKPFWAWNGKLEPEELRRQVRLMKRMGIGGFFMHSRVGLDTPYLSNEWFECINACVEEATKCSMEAWLYDEDRWPSGAAGGLITIDQRFRSRSLILRTSEKITKNFPGKHPVALFAARRDGDEYRFRDVRRLPNDTSKVRKRPDEVFLSFEIEIAEGSSWYNGNTYIDVFNPLAVREFIRITHEAYRKHSGQFFGTVIPGFFTDEPCLNNPFGGGSRSTVRMPWTDKLPVTFRKRYGYDIVGLLPWLFFDIEAADSHRVRLHYRDCITYLFVDSFARQIGEWCEKYDLLFTGHVLGEGTLTSQAFCVGSCMRFYEYMQAPGMDLLTEHAREYDTAKQVSSMAHQFRRSWRLSETFGCTGWDFPFSGHKALGDWQTALGINLRCPHLAWYTMEGEAKRDFPASIFYQSSWWEQYSYVEDYFARITAVMTKGEEIRDILVIHPIESTWSMIAGNGGDWDGIRKLDADIVKLRDSLLAMHLDFDYGDEEILSRHGKIGSGPNGPVFKINKASYSAVIVPPMRTIRAATMDLLCRFKEKGGIVLFCGDPPTHIDGMRNAEAARLAEKCAHAAPSNAANALLELLRRVSIAAPDGQEIAPALYLLRADRDAYYLFICNTGRDFTKDEKDLQYDPRVKERTAEFPDIAVTGFPDCEGDPVEPDPVSGEIYAADAVKTERGWRIRTSLPKLGSRLFVVPRKKDALQYPRRPEMAVHEKIRIENSGWPYLLTEHNALILDRPSFRLDNNPEQGMMEILRIDREVRSSLGLQPRGGAMVQPWAQKKDPNPRSVQLRLHYVFRVGDLPSGALLLALEQPSRYTIDLNGTRVSTDMIQGWWVDRSLQTLPLESSLLRQGANDLVISCSYDSEHPGLEIIYLLGNFGVHLDETGPELTRLPDLLHTGDWTPQGLPFYSGSVCYLTRIDYRVKASEKLFIRVPSYEGTAVRILVDGTEAGIIAWEPQELDITAHIKDSGSTSVCIQVIGSRRNSHGPLHNKHEHIQNVGPGSFMYHPDTWQESYNVVKCGLMEQPEFVVKRIIS